MPFRMFAASPAPRRIVNDQFMETAICSEKEKVDSNELYGWNVVVNVNVGNNICFHGHVES
jgi:hypothetical protein